MDVERLTEACLLVAQRCRQPLLPWEADYTAELTEARRVGSRFVLAKPKGLLLVPRRNGKTHTVLNRCLAGAAVLGESVLWTVHNGDTLRETWNQILKLCEPGGPLARFVKVSARSGKPAIVRSQGSESVTFWSGGYISLRVRTASGGRGRECTTLVFDEALELTHDQMAALTALRAKAEAQGIGQTIYLSSAGHGSSVVLADLREHALAGGERWHAREYAAPRDVDITDRTWWAAANPSLGTDLLSMGFLEDQFDSLDEESFGREHLGWFTELVGEPWMPSDAWLSGHTADPPLVTGRPVLGFETQLSGTAVLVAAWALADGHVWVEPVQAWSEPTTIDPAKLAADIGGHARRLGASALAADKLTCETVLELCRRKVRTVKVMGPAEMRAASMRTLELATGGRLGHSYSEEATTLMLQATGVTGADGGRRILRAKSATDTCLPLATAAAVWLAVAPQQATPVTAGLVSV